MIRRNSIYSSAQRQLTLAMQQQPLTTCMQQSGQQHAQQV
jgi:hypothetical protein